MIYLLALTVVINFNIECHTLTPTQPEKEYTFQFNQESDRFPFEVNIEDRLQSSVSGSVSLLNEPTREIQDEVDHYSVKEYYITSTYLGNEADV